MLIFAAGMAKQCTDTDEELRMINQRLRKLEKSDSEKTEEIGRLNRIIGQKDKEIHSLKVDLASTKSELAGAKARIKELEGDDGDEDYSSGTSGKPEKNSSNSSVPPSQESIAARELRRTKSLRKPSGKPSGGQQKHYFIRATEVKGEKGMDHVACIVQRSNPHLDEIIQLFDSDITMFNEMKP